MKTCVKCGSSFDKKSCRVCANLYSKKWRLENKKRVSEYNTNYSKTNIDTLREKKRTWRLENPTSVSLSKTKYNKSVSGKKAKALWKKLNPLSDSLSISLWRSRNLSKLTSYRASRRAVKLNAVPSWLTGDDKFFIQEMYNLAKLRTKTTGIVWEVDHIIPLQGKLVCGLHVLSNLQVITQSENRRKSNGFSQGGGQEG